MDRIARFLPRKIINLRRNTINAYDVITFGLYLMDRMRRNLIKITSVDLTGFTAF